MLPTQSRDETAVEGVLAFREHVSGTSAVGSASAAQFLGHAPARCGRSTIAYRCLLHIAEARRPHVTDFGLFDAHLSIHLLASEFGRRRSMAPRRSAPVPLEALSCSPSRVQSPWPQSRVESSRWDA